MSLEGVVKPLYSDVLVTMNMEKIESDLIIPESARQQMLSDVQNVVAVGGQVNEVKPGDEVKIKMMQLMVLDKKWVKGKTSNANDEVQQTGLIVDPNRMHKIDGKDYMLIREGEIAYVMIKPEDNK